MITENTLKNASFTDFSIMEVGKNKNALILICKTIDVAKNLHALLSENYYTLTLLVDNNKKYQIKVEFLNSEFGMVLNTDKTAIDYPPLKWLAEGRVKYITTGINEGGQQRRWNQNLLDLEAPQLN